MNTPLQVTSEGVYLTSCGKTVDVVNVSSSPNETYFRAYWGGGWYNVNPETDVLIDHEGQEVKTIHDEREMECVERVGEIERSQVRVRLTK